MSELVPFNCPPIGPKMLQNEEEAGEFVVRLCHDVLLEVLFFGDRCQLTKSERIGRLFHRIIEDYREFKESPFLRLRLRLSSLYFRLSANIAPIGLSTDGEKLSFPSSTNLSELTMIPPFLRFHEVVLSHDCGKQSIEEKCAWAEKHLLPFKAVLNDSNMTQFVATISQYGGFEFGDHSKLLDYIRNGFLTVCNSSRSYRFWIRFHSDKNSAAIVIASILQMDAIKTCSNVHIKIFNGDGEKKLPVEEISNWLNNANPIQNERFLSCNNYPGRIQNVKEMLDHLKTKFVEAESPVRPFSFIFGLCDQKELGIEAETLTNKKTGEVLSINLYGKLHIEIKRARKKTKKN